MWNELNLNVGPIFHMGGAIDKQKIFILAIFAAVSLMALCKHYLYMWKMIHLLTGCGLVYIIFIILNLRIIQYQLHYEKFAKQSKLTYAS